MYRQTFRTMVVMLMILLGSFTLAKPSNQKARLAEGSRSYDGGIKNSYPTLIEVRPGDVRGVWDSGTAEEPRTHIHFGKLRIMP